MAIDLLRLQTVSSTRSAFMRNESIRAWRSRSSGIGLEIRAGNSLYVSPSRSRPALFFWTPPHFWALALYRKNEYAKVGVPMLPVTHGERYTRRHILLYTFILVTVSLLPFYTRMSGLIYGASAVVLGGIFIAYAVRLNSRYSDRLAHTTFRYSITYLTLLFAALLVDHYCLIRL